MLNDELLLQYSRQILLPTIGIEGQEKLLNAHVVILGVGGLGSPVTLYLAAAGVGKLTLIDDDSVELSNLQRQIIHQVESIGQLKVDSAAKTIKKSAPQSEVFCVSKKQSDAQLSELIEQADVVVDCCDNFATRFQLNRLCFAKKIPLVSGAAIRWEGQLSTFTMKENTPCYQCLYAEDTYSDQTCTQNGVISPLVGVIGSMQAMEVIKLIVGCGDLLEGRLMLFDGLSMTWQNMQFKSKEDCNICHRVKTS